LDDASRVAGCERGAGVIREHHDNYVLLGYAVIQQAADDVRDLTARGLIRDGKAVDPWPPAKKVQKIRRECGYRKPYEVKQLIRWWTCGGAKDWIDLLGAKIDLDAALVKMGLNR
jgi:hypothetical protein